MIFLELSEKNGADVNKGTSTVFILHYIKNIKINDSSVESFNFDSEQCRATNHLPH